MKKFVKHIALTALAASLCFIGCKSNDKAKNLAGVQQNEEAGRPRWVGHDFDYDEAEYFTGGYKPSSNGIFASGKAKRADTRQSEIAARLDARANLASRVTAEIGRAAADNGLSAENITVENVSATLAGSRVIDTYTDVEDGTVYILMFISEKDLKKTSAGGALEEFVDLWAAEMATKLANELSNEE